MSTTQQRKNPLSPIEMSSTDLKRHLRSIKQSGIKIEEGKLMIPELDIHNETEEIYRSIESQDRKNLLKGLLSVAQQSVQAAYYTNQIGTFHVKSSNFINTEVKNIFDNAIKSGNFSKVVADTWKASQEFIEKFYEENDGIMSRVAVKAHADNFATDMLSRSINFSTQKAQEQSVNNMRALTSSIADTVRADPSELSRAVRQIEELETGYSVATGSLTQGRQFMEQARSELIMGGIQQAAQQDFKSALALYEEHQGSLSSEQSKQTTAFLNKIGQAQILEAQQKLQEEASEERILGILSGNIQRTDVNNAMVGRDVESVFSRWSDIKNTRPAYATLSKEDIVVATGYLPKDYSSELTMSLTFGNANQIDRAASALLRIQKESPAGMRNIDKGAVAQAYQYQTFLNATQDKATAATLMRKMQTIPDAEAQALEIAYAELYKQNKPIEQMMQSIFPVGGIQSDWASPTNQIQFSQQADELLQFFFKAMKQNFPAALSLATQEMSRTWGQSSVLGASAYNTYMPIEHATSTTDIQILEYNLKSMLRQFPETKNLDFKNVQMHWAGTNPENNQTLYKVYIYDQAYGGSIFPLMVEKEDQDGNPIYTSVEFELNSLIQIPKHMPTSYYTVVPEHGIFAGQAFRFKR